MSRRTGIRVTVTVFLLAAAAVPAFADSGPTLTLSTNGTVLWGTAYEILYYNGYVLSELTWPLQPAFTSGSGAELEWPGGLYLHADVGLGIKAGSGNVTDSDYLNLDYPYHGSVDTRKTNFSEHDGNFQGSISAEGQIGWRLSFLPQLDARPYLGFRYLDYRWTAENGYYQYPADYGTGNPPYTPWSSSETKTRLYGVVGALEQTYLIPLFGTRFSYAFGDPLSVSAGVEFSPIVWLYDVDDHFLRYLQFYDSMFPCTFVNPAISVLFHPIASTTLSLRIEYLYVTSPTDGTTVELDTTTGARTTYAGSTGNGAGGGISAFGATIAVTLGL